MVGGLMLETLIGLVVGLLVGAVLWRGRSPGAAARPVPAVAVLAAAESGGQLVQVIADSVPDAVLFFSDLGVIRYANAVARELFFEGRAPEGQNFLRLADDAPLALREALLGESDRLFSMDLDGRRETYHLSRRVFMLSEEPHTLLVVKYMTREISRREVDVLKRVVRVISHEVNNSLAPVTSLVHSARLMVKNPEHLSKLARVFDTIDERTLHLKTFLDGYAALARLPKPRPRSVDYAEFVPALASLYPDVRWPEPPVLHGWFDPIQVEQVIINLVKNAIEAGSDAGTVEVAMRVHEDGTSEVDVLDRGQGFAPEALQNALLPLYTTKDKGSGMGLSLSQEIVEAHGGSISLTNRSDGGAKIRLILPGKAPPTAQDLARSRLTLTLKQGESR
jgi:nitrogen fixation/metabolism regulation signal transduction histidine kinase